MNDEVNFGAWAIASVFQVAIGALFGAIFLRAACGIYNSLFGSKTANQVVNSNLLVKAKLPVEANRPFIDDGNPFRAPQIMESNASSLILSGVPEPAFGKAFLIVLIANLVTFAVSVVVGFASSSVAGRSFTVTIAAVTVSVLISFLIQATVTS